MKRAVLLLVPLLACLLLTAGAKQSPKMAILVNPQASSATGGEFSRPVQLLHSKKEVPMGVLPLLTHSEFKSFHAFKAPDGTWGASFRLDPHGKNLLEQHTLSMRGSYLFVWVNGRQVIDLFVDRPVRDGIFTIPRGLTANEAEMMKYQFPAMGREKDKLPKAPKTPKEPKAVPAEDAKPENKPSV